MRSWFIRFAGCAALALAATACLDPENGCTPTSCPEESTCDPETLACVYTCEPACPAHQYCAGNGACAARYTALELTVPAQSSFVAKQATVQARLNLASAVTQYKEPGTVRYNATFADGQDAGYGVLTAGSNGTFSGQWNVPGDTGTFKVAATHVETGLVSATHQVTLDTKPPVFQLIATAPTRNSGTAGQRANENDPALPGAWKRDEIATVYAVADEAVNESTAQMYLWTVSDGGTLAGPPLTYPLETATGGPCGSSPYCGRLIVDLADIDIPVFRGNLHVAAVGNDIAGNVGSGDAGLPVTRLKWVLSLDATESHRASPAVGSRGDLYIGTANNVNGTAGRTIAISPLGQVRWKVDGGAVLASPAVAVIDGGSEIVFVGSNSESGSVVTSYRSDAGTFGTCGFSNGTIEAGLAVSTTQLADETAPVPTAFSALNTSGGSSPIAVRPLGGSITCENILASGSSVSFPATAIATGPSTIFNDASGAVRRYTLSDQGNFQTDYSRPLALIGRGLAMSSNTIVVGGNGVAVSDAFVGVDASDGGTVWRLDGLTADPWSIAVDADGRALAGRTNSASVVVTRDGGSAVERNLSPSNVRTTPVLGEDGRSYFASASGVLACTRPDGVVEWVGALSAAEASPTIDCSRDAFGVIRRSRPAVLYVLTTGGTLNAISVDSRGIDTTARWPKWQHDPRNTGNPSTSLSEFTCE